MPTSREDLNDPLAEAAIACANKAKDVAETDGQPLTAEIWASAAAQLAFAAKNIAGGLPARPGRGG